MANNSDTWFHDSIKLLTYNRNQRVWSIIVTIFGDLAGTPGDRISGAALSRITEPMSIKPEAMRVALHRLRNDDWIDSHKEGRSSFYGLTRFGLEQSTAARPRIYAREVDLPSQWQLCALEPGGGPKGQRARDMRHRGFVAVLPGLFLGPVGAAALPDSLVFHGAAQEIPAWVQEKIATPEITQAYGDLERALDRFSVSLLDAPALSPHQVATLRSIIVHIWRRALLSHPDLPQAFFGEGWRGGACRIKVMDVLDRLGRPQAAQL
ncbi:PaaX family transcriptional regulator C-terminal domain-containing protein [Shimia sp.]|uniref:PaaX family transcriptional regulator C-terminal domain-containing protein n=1 Tax=Shimia sp. TaxID=1954381 RepID=UPI00356A0F46